MQVQRDGLFLFSLFLVFINDLLCVTANPICLFADDSILLFILVPFQLGTMRQRATK